MAIAGVVVAFAATTSVARAESITGAVSDGGLGGYSGVCVEAFSAGAGPDAPPVAQTISDNVFYPGHWSLTVTPGNYKIRFAACGGPSDSQFQPEWFQHFSGWGSAETVSVAPGQTRDTGPQPLSPAHPMGNISGTLTAPDGTPANGWCAVALDPAGSGFDGSIRTYDVTDANGRYKIEFLRTGPWKVFFTTRCGRFTGTRFDEEHYNDKGSFASADPVTVNDGQTTAGIDATLNWMGGVPPGRIEGTVTVGGNPRAGVCVGALNPASGDVIRGTVSDSDGKYYLPYLDRGGYKVVFGTSECSAAQGPSVPRMFYNGQTDFAAAQEVPVVYSAVTGIDMAYPALAQETIAHTVAAGGTVSTDTGAGATAADPLTVGVTSPAAGAVTITETRTATTTPPPGLSLLGYQVEIEAPVASVGAPLRLLFTLDSSAIAGLDPDRIFPLRDGEPAGECQGSTKADPDPCVTFRNFDRTTGDLALTVLASHASTWNFAEIPKRCVVPKLVGLKLTKASKALKEAGCKLGKVKKKASSKKKGTVIAQKPKPKTIKPFGAKVAVTVSKG